MKIQELKQIEISPLTKEMNNWDKVLKNGPSKICGKQPLKNLN